MTIMSLAKFTDLSSIFISVVGRVGWLMTLPFWRTMYVFVRLKPLFVIILKRTIL